MKQHCRLLVALTTGCSLLLLPLFSRAAEVEDVPRVIISEIAWAGSSVSQADEWLELTNLTDEPIDLSGWSIDGAGSSGSAITLPSESRIEPHSIFLIANYADNNEKTTLNRPPDLVTTAVSLSNSGLGLVLRDDVGAEVDVATDGGPPVAGGADGAGTTPGGRFAAMVRGGDLTWQTATESIGFDEGATELGTPGTIESWFVLETIPVPEPELELEPVAFDPVEETEPELILEPVVEQELVEELPVATVEDSSKVAEELAILPPPLTPPQAGGGASELIETIDVFPEPVEGHASDADATASTSSADSGVDPVTSEDSTETIDPVTDSVGNPIETPESIVEELAILTPPLPPPQAGGEANEPVAIMFPVGTLVINELVSDPADDVEWVEIMNPYNNVIPLAGWTVSDGSGKKTSLPDQLIGFGQFVVIKNPSGKLNNDGDTVELLDPSGVIIDRMTYGADGVPVAKKPNALARDGAGAFVVTTTPTPGEPNRLTPMPVKIVKAKATTPVAVPKPIEAPKVVPISIEPVMLVETEQETIAAAGPITLRISELYPNTSGDDLVEEFIELENFGLEAIDLREWQIEDASGRSFTQHVSVIIAPGAFLTLPRTETKLALNNTGDTVRLIAPDKTLVDEYAYERTAKGSSLARIGADWHWTADVTPDEPNRLSQDDGERLEAAGAELASKQPTKRSAGTSRSTGPRAVTIADALEVPDGISIKTSGIVLTLPGSQGRQILYVTDSGVSIQVFKYDARFPDLVVGDRIAFTGTMSTVRGERRIKLPTNDTIAVLGQEAVPEPIEVSANALNGSLPGAVVRTRGVVLSRSGSQYTIEGDGIELSVRLPNDSASIEPLAPGTTVAVTGILVPNEDSFRLLARTTEDIEILKPAAEISEPTKKNGKAQRDAGHQQTAGVVAGASLVSLIGLAVRHFLLQPK